MGTRGSMRVTPGADPSPVREHGGSSRHLRAFPDAFSRGGLAAGAAPKPRTWRQRHASVVVQKSIAEGFGLTVAEAMWKSRPIVASAVGGIVDQVTNGEHGLLVEDPRDPHAFGGLVDSLLRDRAEAERLGANARERARTEFLGDRHLAQYGRILEHLA